LHTANAVTVELQTVHANCRADSSAVDGIPDDWKLNGFRGLDLKALGCKPGQVDIIAFVARYSTVDEQRVKDQLDRVVKYYANLPTKDPDGTTGWHLHLIYQDPIPPDDQKNPWWVNRDKYLPAKYRGLAHWMQVTPGGGGQADQLGDGGTCGQNALWQVFTHEFGHQLGMDHNGFWGPAFCPIYPSLMNYAYSYSLDGSPDKVGYSTGKFDRLVLREDDLDEVLPYPIKEVEFLSQGPYHYRLQADGDKTLIDWNWNGIFGEHHVRAEINYSYATSAGERDPVDKTNSAPWLFTADKQAYLLFAKRDIKEGSKEEPTVSADHPGTLEIRRLIQPKLWTQPQLLDNDNVSGDPVAIDFKDTIYIFYQTPKGLEVRLMKPGKDGLDLIDHGIIDNDPTLVPTCGQADGRLFLFLWNPANGKILYRELDHYMLFDPGRTLDVTSEIAPGFTVDTVTHQIVIGLAQDQGTKKNRWQVRYYKDQDGELVNQSMDWIEGEKGGASGMGRCTLLFDTSSDAPPDGRIMFYCQGTYGKENPWSCVYVAEQIADKTWQDGWLVKRYYDEWTQTRSAPGVCWYGNDVLYAYRWVDGGYGASDNILHVGYNGLGITDEPMGDHDDLTYMQSFGIPYGLVYLQTGKDN